MIELVAFGIILDDLVFPDGRTAMRMLGGSGPQAALGMRLPVMAGWTRAYDVGLAAGVGPDLPPAAWDWLRAAGLDLEGVRASDLPTPRAWQLNEAGGARTQVWRVPGHVIGAQLGGVRNSMPPSYRGARGFHLGVHPDDPDLDFIVALRRPAGQAPAPLISLEPFKPADRPLSDAALRALAGAADIFSPNLIEARSLVGEGIPQAMAQRLAHAGARIVALRMGAEGSLIHAPGAGVDSVFIPALPVDAADTTGAGNAYCGGFLAGCLHTGDPVAAGRWGTVAASFLIEQIGLPPITPQMGALAQERLEVLREA